jgi:hypothetical protein
MADRGIILKNKPLRTIIRQLKRPALTDASASAAGSDLKGNPSS